MIYGIFWNVIPESSSEEIGKRENQGKEVLVCSLCLDDGTQFFGMFQEPKRIFLFFIMSSDEQKF